MRSSASSPKYGVVLRDAQQSHILACALARLCSALTQWLGTGARFGVDHFQESPRSTALRGVSRTVSFILIILISQWIILFVLQPCISKNCAFEFRIDSIQAQFDLFVVWSHFRLRAMRVLLAASTAAVCRADNIPTGTPEEVGLDPARLQAVDDYLHHYTLFHE